MSGRDKATNQLKDYQKKRGPGVRSVVECSTDGTTVVLTTDSVQCTRSSHADSGGAYGRFWRKRCHVKGKVSPAFLTFAKVEVFLANDEI